MGRLLRLAALAIWLLAASVVLLGLLLLVLPAPAHAQASAAASAAGPVCPEGATCSTGCGAGGTGLWEGKLLKSNDPRFWVDAEGRWQRCNEGQITRDSKCGAPGVGVTYDGILMFRETPGARVDATGRWIECERTCPAKSSSLKEWTVNGLTCKSSLDLSIKHGQSVLWRQWNGPVRGDLIEACTDGVRRVVSATCEKATFCEASKIGPSTRQGRDGKELVFAERQVPGGRLELGQTFELRAASGETLVLMCRDGSIVDAPPLDPPRPEPTPQARTCGTQTWNAVLDGQRQWLSVTEPLSTPAGGRAKAKVLGSQRAVPVECGQDGRFSVVPEPAPPSSGIDEWLRMLERLLGQQR